MEITISSWVSSKHSIDLPYYSKNTIGFYKIISENETLEVMPMNSSIRLYNYVPSQAIDSDHVKITEDEFTNNYFIVQGKLNAKLI